jgi:hypothetical protein
MRRISRLRTLLVLVALVTTLGVIAATQVIAQDGGAASNTGKPKVSQSGIGTQTLQDAHTNYAVCNSGGGLALAQSLGALSCTRLALGTYQVIFDHNVRACAYEGTIGLVGAAGVPPPGEISVVGLAVDVRGVFVKTYSSGGASADRAFHLAVHCKG